MAATPSALQATVGARWYGYDGKWSPVDLRVGSPPQWVSVLVSTVSTETWVVGTGGCSRANDSICRDNRGRLFNPGQSSTWNYVGNYELGLDPHLGFSGIANYGYDNVNFDDQVIVPDQIVGVINTTEFWLGFLGLGIEETNFTDVNKQTFLTTLADQTRIPSRSYGYTAGASYRLKGVPASLTLGGFDSNRFEPHETSFVLGPKGAVVVALEEITLSASPLDTSGSPSWPSSPFTLLGRTDAGLFTVDSSTPFLWLPEKACDQFANALGLQYDSNLQLYTFGDRASQHDTLVNWNMTFTFKIADLVGSTKTLDIKLPYGAFDLQLSYPYPGLNATATSAGYNYFPLRRAVNDTQYTLGRSFLQESYLIVDHDRKNFSISQAKFASDALENVNLVPIARPVNNTNTVERQQSSGSSGLSKGAIGGIVFVAIIGMCAIAILVFYLLRRRHNRAKLGVHIPLEQAVAELHFETLQPKELSAENQEILEFQGSMPAELPGEEPPELPDTSPRRHH